MANTELEKTVSLCGVYGIGSIARLVADLEPLLEADEPTAFHIDLSRLGFLYPSTAAVITAALSRASDTGLLMSGGRITLPANDDVRNYLLRVDVLQEALGRELSEQFNRRQTVGFRECQTFRTEDESVVAARELTSALAERCALNEAAKQAIFTCLAELCQNVPHHADAPCGGVAAAQGYPQRGRFEAAIVDLGIGVRASMQANPLLGPLGDDSAAIAKALEIGVTSKPGDGHRTRHSGHGLSVTQGLLTQNGGKLVIRSGAGEVWVGAEPRVEQSRHSLPGTLVVFEAWTARRLDIGQVYYDLLGELDE